MTNTIENIKRRLHDKLLVATLIACCFSFSSALAQESLNSTGGNASGSGGSMSYSVGQVVYTTNTGPNGSLAQGVQQPYEISVISGLNEAKDINLTIASYPNPTSDYVILDVKNLSLSDLTFQLYDINGKLLQNNIIAEELTRIDMTTLVTATYLIKVTQGNQVIKTFKIIKN